MKSNTNSIVVVRDLTKSFGKQEAVNTINFEIQPGEVVGFLGPNGAGKTTTIRLLLNLLVPTSGLITLFGLEFQHHRKEILRQMNSSSGTVTLPGKLTVKQILTVFADLYGIPHATSQIASLLKKFDLEELKDRQLYSLSSGQQVRVSLAKSFINNPRLLLLDEPTANLDPDVADRVRSLLLEMSQNQGTTVFLTSHNMREVETVCSRVLFINNGKIEAEGSPKELARQVKRWHVTVELKSALKTLPDLTQFGNPDISMHDQTLIADIDRNHVGPFLTELIKLGSHMKSINIQEPTLEDFFVHTARQHKPEAKE